MKEVIMWASALGGLALTGYWLYGLTQISLEWMYRRAIPEPQPEPEIERFTVQGALYLKQGSVVLDIGRGVVFNLLQGAITEPDRLLVEPEQRRRILHSSPTVNMTVIKQALGIDDGALPPLLPGGEGGSFMPQLQEWEVKDE